MTIPSNLAQYTWALAKAAYEKGEREFGVTPRYPMYAKKEGCSKCLNGVDFVHFLHKDSGYLLLRCAYCTAELKGGLFEIGIRDKPINTKRMFSDWMRWEIFKRDGIRCFMCGAGPAEAELEADHIYPACMGGPTLLENGITLCRSCNQAKSGRFETAFVLKALLHANITQEECACEDPAVAFRVLKRVAQFLKIWNGAECPTRKSI